MKATRFALLVLIGLLALLLALPVMAQDDTSEEPEDPYLFEITGVMTINDDGDIMVDELIIAPANAFNPSIINELEEDQEVTITGYLLNDDTLQAVTFELVVEDEEDDADDEEIDDEVAEEEDEDTSDDCVAEEGDTEEGEDTADDEEADEEEDSECGRQHPIGIALSEEFDVEYDTIMAWREEDLGFGEITRALLIAEQFDDVSVEDVLAQLEEFGNWGAVMQEYDINPGDLAPGRVISNRPEDAGNGNGNGNNGNGNNGNGNGNNGNGNGNNGNGNGGGNGNGSNGNGNGNNGNNGNGNGGGNGGGNGNGNGGGNG